MSRWRHRRTRLLLDENLTISWWLSLPENGDIYAMFKSYCLNCNFEHSSGKKKTIHYSSASNLSFRVRLIRNFWAIFDTNGFPFVKKKYRLVNKLWRVAANAPLLVVDSYFKMKFNIDSGHFIGAVQCLFVSGVCFLSFPFCSHGFTGFTLALKSFSFPFGCGVLF